jgi:hypothetical protein
LKMDYNKKKGSFVTWCGEYSKNIEP